MRIRGYVTQIISPDDLHNYIGFPLTRYFDRNRSYLVILETEEAHDIGTGDFIILRLLKLLWYRLRHSPDDYGWILAFKNVNFKEGDRVNVDCDEWNYKPDLLVVKR